jgi:FkbM family methyltransferase
MKPIKQSLKQLSQQLGIYKRLRYSHLYYFLLRYSDPNYFNNLKKDFEFYRMSLGTSLKLIFDVGANHGDKAWIFKELAEKVVCVEPDEYSFSALSMRYSNNSRIKLENIALGDREEQKTFFVEADGSALNTLSEKQKNYLNSNYTQSHIREISVSVSTLDALIAKYGIPDFLKIDVEGYELEVLSGLSYKIPIIGFEANLPTFRDETIKILERFRQSGEAISFNLMKNYNFVFPSKQSYDSVASIINQEEQMTTYDIFVYSDLERSSS